MKVCLVPRDFVVEAMDELSVLDRSVGRTYALTDPNPPTVRQLVDTFARHLGKRVIWVPLPLGLTRVVVGSVPGMERLLGLPAEALDYFASPTTYSTANTVGGPRRAPAWSARRSRATPDRLLDFMTEHPEVDSAAMV